MKSKHILSFLIVLGILILVGINLFGSENGGNDYYAEIMERDQVMITEIVAKNASLAMDSVGNYVDLIELYNPTDKTVNLTGYGLSDDPSVPHKWIFPDVVIQPKTYVIVYATPVEKLEIPLEVIDKETYTEQAKLYTNFSLDASGESLALSNPEGIIIDEHRFGRLEADMSYGLKSKDLLALTKREDAYGYYVEGTPGAENSGSFIDNIQEYFKVIEFNVSRQPGIYKSGFDLSIGAVKDYSLRYTLDGSDPTIESNLYNGPITITDGMLNPVRYARIPSTFSGGVRVQGVLLNRGTVVKAQYYKGDVAIGDMFVGTYFVFKEGNKRYDFDIVSLTTDPANLFDPDTGIHVVGTKFEELAPENPDGSTPANYNQRGPEWEREAHVEFFGQDGKTYYDQNLGIKIFGGWSRANPKKSFKLIPRKEYDDEGNLAYPFFEGLENKNGDKIESFDKLLLRSGANDYEFTMFRDVLTQELSLGITDSQAYKPVVLFLNGEYWGIYNLREHMDEHYVEAHFNVPKEEVSMIVYRLDIELYSGEESELTRFNQLLDEMDGADLSNQETYEYFTEKIDIQNMIDYYITQIYVDNVDWPANNSKIWRYTGEPEEDKDSEEVNYKDGRYRFLLYDTEFNFGLYKSPKEYTHNSFEMLSDENSEEWPNFAWSTIMYRKFMENEDFRKLFFVRMEDLLNSRYEKEVVIAKIEEMADLYQAEMEEYIKRYNFWKVESIEDWEVFEVYNLKAFAENRGPSLFNLASRFYDLEGHKRVSFAASGGVAIRINDSYNVKFENRQGEILENKDIKLFSDYDVQISAKVEEGYEFIRWEIEVDKGSADSYIVDGGLENRTMIISPKENMSIKAIVEKK